MAYVSLIILTKRNIVLTVYLITSYRPRSYVLIVQVSKKKKQFFSC